VCRPGSAHDGSVAQLLHMGGGGCLALQCRLYLYANGFQVSSRADLLDSMRPNQYLLWVHSDKAVVATCYVNPLGRPLQP
jgi:hypothetical protein